MHAAKYTLELEQEMKEKFLQPSKRMKFWGRNFSKEWRM